MKHRVVALAVLLWTLDASAKSILLTDVNVLPMDTPRVLERHSILITDGVIQAIGPVGSLLVPPDTIRVDGQGGFVLPGLSDLHAHIGGALADETSDVAANQFLLYLATGVTLLRDPGGSDAHFDYRRRINAGELLGPDLHFTSPILEGEDAVWDFAVQVVDPADVEPLIEGFAEQGYWGVKIYHTLSATVFDAVVEAARRHGLPVIGHVPFEVGIERALAKRMFSIEHLRGYDFDGLSAVELEKDGGRSARRFSSIARMTDARRTELVERTFQAGTWNVPTLVIARFLWDAKGREALARQPRFGLVHPAIQDAVKNASALDALFSPESRRTLQEVLPHQQALVRELHSRGAGILIGTDSVLPAYVPGFTPIDEMQAIAAAGIENFEVLHAATLKAAQALGVAGERGTVAVGKRASLIVLAENPVEDLAALWSLKGVLHRGRWLPLASLEHHLRDQLERD